MTKKLWIVAAVTLVACAYLVVVLPYPRVTKANFDCIQDGATKADVEKLLGDPSADSGPKWKIIFVPIPPRLSPGSTMAIWNGHYGVALIHFNKNSVVTYKGWFPVRETLYEKVCRWLFER
jgi:hypothetical protein